jgi:hypothetical protein
MSRKPVNPGNHPIKGLSECNEVSPLQEERNTDKPSPICINEEVKGTQKDVSNDRPDLGWLRDAANKKVGIGRDANCDPMQTGQIVENVKHPDRTTVYRYSKSIRGAHEAMTDLFTNLVVIDEEGQVHPVPIVWGTQERAVAWILQDNVRKDNSTVVDRIRLPMLSIHNNDIQFDQTKYIYHGAVDYHRDLRPDRKPAKTISEKYERDTVFGVARGLPINITYTLTGWTLYLEDMDQIVEQIMLKFSPVAYISVRGVQWETIVTLDSVANNVDLEPGNTTLRVIKYQFNMTAQTFIPQPIRRTKAVLKTVVDIHNDIEPENINEVLGRIEEAVEELEQ